MSGAHNTARCYGTGKKTGAPVWPYDADYMRVTPTFREGSPGIVVCLSRGEKEKRGRLKERGSRVCGCIILLSRTDMFFHADRVRDPALGGWILF